MKDQKKKTEVRCADPVAQGKSADRDLRSLVDCWYGPSSDHLRESKETCQATKREVVELVWRLKGIREEISRKRTWIDLYHKQKRSIEKEIEELEQELENLNLWTELEEQERIALERKRNLILINTETEAREKQQLLEKIFEVKEKGKRKAEMSEEQTKRLQEIREKQAEVLLRYKTCREQLHPEWREKVSNLRTRRVNLELQFGETKSEVRTLHEIHQSLKRGRNDAVKEYNNLKKRQEERNTRLRSEVEGLKKQREKLIKEKERLQHQLGCPRSEKRALTSEKEGDREFTDLDLAFSDLDDSPLEMI